MTEQEALAIMIPPAKHRPGKWLGSVIQIHITRACDKACFSCTQGSNLSGRVEFISNENFEKACISLKGYQGVVGCFGGNCCLHPKFPELCAILAKHIPKNQRGLWSNNLNGHGALCRKTFNHQYSNLNVHLDQRAYDEIRRDWPEARPFGLKDDSRHSPPFVAMNDIIDDESKRWDYIAHCPINISWSALLGVFRGQIKAWFCEIAGAQSILNQDDPEYPDTGLDPTDDECPYCCGGGMDGRPLRNAGKCLGCGGSGKRLWWQLPMDQFAEQARWHCHRCSVPLNGYGELAQADDDKGKEQTSATYAHLYKPKRKGRSVELVTTSAQLGKPLDNMVNYIQNSKV